MEFSPTPADWLKILKKNNTGDPKLDKVVERHKRKPKPDTGGTTGRGPLKTPEGTRDPSGKIKPHRPGR